MPRIPRNKTVAQTVVTVRLTRAEIDVLKKQCGKQESLGQCLRRLALERCEATA